jgi:DNA-binding MarR family transcriptional regulator/GNAT superfamily N-acetyltransferase
MPDVIAELEELALASRLKHLSESMLKEADILYQDLGVTFEPRWFLVFHTLGRHGPMTITDLAQSLGLTHPAVSQVAAQLLAAGLIGESRDGRDGRRRLIGLSPSGRRMRQRLEPVWAEIKAAARKVLVEADVDLLRGLERLEAVLAQRSITDRVRAELGLAQRHAIRIVDYRPAYKKHFRALNEEWLNAYFTVEEQDARLLNDPNGTILRKGGAVLFALVGDEVAGTGALVRHTERLLQLCKTAVTPRMRGRGIGRRLTEALIARAQTIGGEWLYLQTSFQLKAATRLYQRLGFRRLGINPLAGPQFARPTITMRLKL